MAKWDKTYGLVDGVFTSWHEDNLKCEQSQSGQEDLTAIPWPECSETQTPIVSNNQLYKSGCAEAEDKKLGSIWNLESIDPLHLQQKNVITRETKDPFDPRAIAFAV